MASSQGNAVVNLDTLITIKITVNEQLKKLKLPLRDLGASVLPDKLRKVLDIKSEQRMVLERFSDSAGGYITLDGSNPQVFKTLIRAAKAKGKLRLKATVTPIAQAQEKEAVEEEKPAPKMAEPIVVCSPAYMLSPGQTSDNRFSSVFQAPPPPSRDSVSLDQRSIGSGIFQFREARASQQTLVADEAPVPRPFITSQTPLFEHLAAPPAQHKLVFRQREPLEPTCIKSEHDWSVFCNDCGKGMADAHYHCSICDDGDYDLCEGCVSRGKLCPGEGHWLIKRFMEDGQVVNSTTERISPRKVKSIPALIKTEPSVEEKVPGAFTPETKTLNQDPPAPSRTCNSCVIVLPEREFVTCISCDDFDLCIKCHIANKHGHHPAHGLKPATEDTVLPLAAKEKLAPGRNVRHNAICDGCNNKIYGVRHKCLNCPNWDYCNDCVQNACHSHPRHRFAALYTPIADQGPSIIRHFGIYCDGPLCSQEEGQSYIQGVRYKCTICHDMDFCAACEALPGNHHNRTHPLLKLNQPVRSVNISTENEDDRGNVRVMGDRHAEVATSSIATETLPVPVNAATPVQTVIEIKPTEVKKEEIKPVSIPVKKFEAFSLAPPAPPSKAPEVSMALLNAHFVRDTIADGMVVEPETRFTQIWFLKNPGPYVWPAGCSVRYVGGDNMLNVDNSHPASVAAINDATESNVVGREVAVGEEVAFKVVLKAPTREGKAISYWRLKAVDGTPFGHRLWCDIEVKKAEQQTVKVETSHLQPFMPQAAAKPTPPMPMRTYQARHSMPLPPARIPQPPFMSSEQPPAYDSVNLSARLAAMREQQKQRREQMIAQLNAQRDSLQAQGVKREDMPSWVQHVNPSMGIKSPQHMNEQERREALRQRVAHIKANIMKTREEREKLAEEFNKQKVAAAERKAGEESAKVKKIVEAVAKHAVEENKAGEENLEGSQMVFPKLEKESPASSTYQSATSSSSKGVAAYVENEAGEVERSATPAPVPAPSAVTSPSVASPFAEQDDFVDIEDELEVLSANEDESEDDGFLTDEEWDVLDGDDA